MFVLDNSVGCGWLIENQRSACADSIALRLETETARAPALLRLEYASVLRTSCRRQRMTARQAQTAIAALSRRPIEMDREAPDAAMLLALGLRYRLSACDPSHLELALRRQLPIGTCDEALAEAARLAGVRVVQQDHWRRRVSRQGDRRSSACNRPCASPAMPVKRLTVPPTGPVSWRP